MSELIFDQDYGDGVKGYNVSDTQDEVELPAATEFRQRPKEEVDAATERICIGGKDSAIDFFSRHPHLGFAIAVDLQCELTERKTQLLASLAANREQKAEIERLTEENSKLHRRNCWLETGIACAKSDRLGMKAKLDAYNSGGFADADAMAERYLDVVNELASLRASAGEKPEGEFPRTVHEWLQDALGRYQVTHIHAAIRAAIKAMNITEVAPLTLPTEKEI